MLSKEEIATVQSTIPLLKDKGVDITSNFYKRMFSNNPELRDMFNQPNHKQGLQSTALAMAVLAAAQHIEDLSPIVPVVMPVAHKHCALQVKPEHYPIVGENLLATIAELTDLSMDDPVIKAWAKAYGEIADAFIGIEKDIYANMAWDGFKPFEVVEINQETEIIKTFTVQSKEISNIEYTPGQYITVDVQVPELPYRAKRHYSIVKIEGDKLTFGVRKEERDGNRGEVSTFLHEQIEVGSTINLSAPVGTFAVENVEKPQLFIGSGIGVTPLFPMFTTASQEGANTHFLQVADDKNNIAFEAQLKEVAAADNAEFSTHLRDTDGYLLKEQLEAYLKENQEIYICGGASFIQSVAKELEEAGVSKENIHYELFVPRLSIAV